MSLRLRADLVLLLVAILWGSAFAAQRVAGGLGSVYFFNAARFLIAAILLLPFLLRASPTVRQWIWMSVAGSVLFAGSALQQAGLVSTTAGNAGFLTSLYVILVPVFLFVLWREHPTRWALGAVVLAGAGAYLLSTNGEYSIKPGDVLELAGAGFWAIHVIVLGRYASAYDALAFSAGQLLVGGVLNGVASGLFERPAWPVAPDLVFAIVYTAVASVGLGYSLQVWGQRHTGPTDAALILSLESVFAAMAGAWLLGESLGPLELVGCGLILIAVALSQLGGSIRMELSGRSRHSP